MVFSFEDLDDKTQFCIESILKKPCSKSSKA